MPSLDDAWAKLNRAKEHFHLLDKEIGDWTTSDAYRIPYHVQENGRVHLWTLERTRPDEELPSQRLALLAGDCIHNARASLDYVAWQLAGADPADRDTQFPIFASRGQFFGTAKQPGRGVKMIVNLSKGAQTLVKWVQPYRRKNPDRDGLAILHALDMDDKHRLLNIIAVRAEGFSFTFANPFYTSGIRGSIRMIGPSKPLKHGAIFGGFILDPPQPQMDVDAKFLANVVFGGGTAEDMGVTATLASLIQQVENALNLFARAWPKIV